MQYEEEHATVETMREELKEKNMDSLTGKPVWCHEGVQVLALDRSISHTSADYPIGYEWRIVQVLPDTDVIVIERDEDGEVYSQSIDWRHCAPAHPKN